MVWAGVTDAGPGGRSCTITRYTVATTFQIYLTSGLLTSISMLVRFGSLFSCICSQQCSILCKLPLHSGHCLTYQIYVLFVDHVCTTECSAGTFLTCWLPNCLVWSLKKTFGCGIASHTFLLGFISTHTHRSVWSSSFMPSFAEHCPNNLYNSTQRRIRCACAFGEKPRVLMLLF